jgi:branched-subunit amino acid transport protein
VRFVSPSVLAAIAVPAVLYPVSDGDLRLDAGNERLFAAALAIVIAAATRNVWLTIAAGMAALWSLNALGV